MLIVSYGGPQESVKRVRHWTRSLEDASDISEVIDGNEENRVEWGIFKQSEGMTLGRIAGLHAAFWFSQSAEHLQALSADSSHDHPDLSSLDT